MSKFYILHTLFFFIAMFSTLSCKNVFVSKSENLPECTENDCSLRFQKPHFVLKISELSSSKSSEWFYIENSSVRHINIEPGETPVFFLSEKNLLLTKKINVDNATISLTLYSLKNGKTEVLSSKNLPEKTASVISSCIMTDGTIALLHKTEIEKPSYGENLEDELWYVLSVTDKGFDSWENYSLFNFESTEDSIYKILLDKNTPDKHPLSVHCGEKNNLLYLSTAVYYQDSEMENIAVYKLDTAEKSLAHVTEYYKKIERDGTPSPFNLKAGFDASEKTLYIMDNNLIVKQKGFSFPKETKISGKKSDFIITSQGHVPTFAFISKEKPEKLMFLKSLK